MLSLSIRQIEYAVATFEFGSISGAAEALNISQPALSVAISRIEEHFGKPLFIRRKGASVVPTSFGFSFLHDANVLLKDFNHLLDNKNENILTKKPIFVGCFIDLAPMMLAPTVIHLKNKFPNINLSTSVGDFELLSKQLKNGTIDFALTYNLGLDADFNLKTIANLKPKIFVEENHKFVGKSKVLLKDLAKEKLVLADQELSVSHIMSLFQQNNITPTIEHRVVTLELMRSYVANGLGVGISYTTPNSDRSYDGKVLKILDFEDYAHEEPIVIATNKYNPPSDIALKLIDEMSLLFKVK